MGNYPTNLTDKQWQVIKNIVETKEWKRKHPLREMINTMMYRTKTGWQGRMLLKEFGPWQTIYFYFRKWKLKGIFEELIHHLRSSVQKAFGRSTSHSISLINSKSIRTFHHINSRKYDIDACKKIKSRKDYLYEKIKKTFLLEHGD